MDIILKNKIFNGKYQWFWFLILDVNDYLGHPFTFILGDGNTFINFTFYPLNYKIGSSKFELSRICWNHQIIKEIL